MLINHADIDFHQTASGSSRPSICERQYAELSQERMYYHERNPSNIIHHIQ
jgi:hypothetical protein